MVSQADTHHLEFGSQTHHYQQLTLRHSVRAVLWN